MGTARAGDLGPRGVYSGFAAASLLLALGSVGGCFAALGLAPALKPSLAGVILVLPAAGLGAAVCGGLALRRIRRSNGMLQGRGAALIGLFAGLLSAVLQGAAGYGAMAAFWPIKREVVPAVAQLVGTGGAFDPKVARGVLSPATAQALEESRLAWFVARLREGAGDGVTPGFELQTLMEARAALARTPGNSGGSAAAPDEWPKPITLRGASGRIVVFVFLDDEVLKKDRVLFRDALEINGDGRARTLLPDGPAARVARWLGAPLDSP